MIKLTNLLVENNLNEDDLFPSVPTLKGLGGVKRGEFDINFSAANDGVGCVFRRNVPWLKKMIKVSANIETRRGLSTKPTKWLGLIFGITAIKDNIISPELSTPLPPEPPGPSVVKIDIDPLTVTDPFEFDKVAAADGKLQISAAALAAINTFIDAVLNIKTTYGDDVYKEYIQFLIDSKPFITGYASIDANPKQTVQGRYGPCRGAIDSERKKTRGAYNKCLSQKRAEAIRGYIESKLPELAGAFQPVGNGETVKFGGTSWPSPGATSETSKPNRRFEVQLPSFNTKRTIPAPAPPPPLPTPPIPKQKTKKTWADWGITYKTGNPDIWNIGEALNLPDKTLQVPIAWDDNSGRHILLNETIRDLRENYKIDLRNYLPSAPNLKFQPKFWDIKLSSSGVEVTQIGGGGLTFNLNTWVLTSGQSKMSNLDLYVATQGTVFVVTNTIQQGWIIGEMSAAIINATRIVNAPKFE